MRLFKQGCGALAALCLTATMSASTGFITVGNDGGSYDYDNITDAIGAAQNFGSLIVVYPGTYAEGPIDFAGKSLTLESNGGPDVTFLEPAASSRVVVIDSGESFGTAIEGFTIRNGSTTGSGGGLVVTNESRIEITNCRFIDNSADLRGGGVFCDEDSLAFITQCSFGSNAAGTTGGGIHLEPTGGCTVERCRFYGNTAVDSGGGAFVGDGGSLAESETPPIILNCSFSGNVVSGEDGIGGGATLLPGLDFIGKPPILDARGGLFGCTIVNNVAASGSGVSGGVIGGLDSLYGIAVVNCILVDNVGGYIGSAYPEPGWYYCCTDFLSASDSEATSSLRFDPRFVDQLGEDGTAGTGDEQLELTPGSACIDAGYTYPPKSSEYNGDFDLAGVTRVLDDPLSDDTGSGGPPVVDIGAYEFVIGAFDDFGICWWTGLGDGVTLADSDNWYNDLIAAPGRDWVLDDTVFITLDQLTTTIGRLDIGRGWLDVDGSGANPKTLRIAQSNFPSFVPANVEVGSETEFGLLGIDANTTLRCRGLDVHGTLDALGGLDLSRTLTLTGEMYARGNTISRFGTSTDPLMVNMGVFLLGSGSGTSTTIQGDYAQRGTGSDDSPGKGTLSIFAGNDVDALVIEGVATLSGGVDVNTEDGVGDFSEGETFTFLTADQGFDGTLFDYVVTRGAILEEELFFVQQVTETFQGGGSTGTSDLLLVSASSLLAGASETEGVGLTLEDMLFADIDGDGFEDLVLSVDAGPASAGSVIVLLNQGATGGTWDGFEQYTGATFSVTVGIEPRGLDVGYVDEVDGNDLLDIVVANSGSGTFTVLTNSSTPGTVSLSDALGPFDSDPDFAGNSVPLDVCVQNLDEDAAGLSDILVTNQRDGSVWAFQNTSTLQGTIVGNEQKSEPDLRIGRFKPREGGGTRDGDTTGSSSDDDGVSSGSAGSGLGGGIIMTWTGYATPAGSAPEDLTVADFNDDGFKDVATANTGDGTISILLATGVGVYGGATSFAIDAGYSEPRSLTAGDLDGDGDIDITYICTRDSDSERVSKILRNTLAAPGNSFGWVVETADDLAGQAPYLVRASDLDLDGTDDVVTLTETTAFLGGTNFGFSAPVANDEDGCPGDFDDDGFVGGSDLAQILGAWGTDDPAVELSGDNLIDGTDLALLLGAWGPCDNGAALD